MRKLICASLTALALMCGVAAAGTTDAFLGNTVVTVVDGASTRWFFEGDGTYAIRTDDGQSGAGVWSVSNDVLCVTPAGGQPLCAPMAPGKGVGDSWQTSNDAGQTFTISIVAGRR